MHRTSMDSPTRKIEEVTTQALKIFTKLSIQKAGYVIEG